MTDAVRCKQNVWTSGSWGSSRCSRKAVRDGYCNKHHPETVAKRQAEAEARYLAEMERLREARRIAYETPIREAVAARDAAWREAVERVSEEGHTGCIRLADGWECGDDCANNRVNAALDALLAAMEAP